MLKSKVGHGEQGWQQGDDDESIGEMLQNAYGAVRENLATGDREELLNTIVERTGITKDEANKTLEKWNKMYGEAKQKFHEASAKAEQAARDAAEATKNMVSRVACWTFASLLVGLAVAAIGGVLGSGYYRS